MQADLETLNEVEIRAMIREHPLSEGEARTLIYAERNGHARKEVLAMLAIHGRKARTTHAIRKAYVEGLNCNTVLV